MPTHPSIVVQRIPWMEEPGRLHTVHGVWKNWTQLINWTIMNNSFTYSLFFSFHFSCYSFNIFKTEPWISLFLFPKHYYFAQAAMETYLRLAGWSKINLFCHGYWRWKSKTKAPAGLVLLKLLSPPCRQLPPHWPSHGLFSVRVHSWGLSVCIISSLYKTIILIGLWPTSVALFYLSA